jgi:hypothetical protein
MEDDRQADSRPAHQPGTRQGSEMAPDEGKEPGREDMDSSGAGRPAGTRTARDATGINPQDPVDPASPKIPPA